MTYSRREDIVAQALRSNVHRRRIVVLNELLQRVSIGSLGIITKGQLDTENFALFIGRKLEFGGGRLRGRGRGRGRGRVHPFPVAGLRFSVYFPEWFLQR
jgi:hypothetical protein